MKSIAKVLLIIMSLLLTIAVQAQEQSEKFHSMDEVVVSATRTEIPVFDVPQDVTVIGSDEIMASPFDRVEDIIRSVPGIYNFRHYSLQTHGIVSPLIMRGVGQNRVLVLVDGVPQNDNFNNAIAWVAWGHIPKDIIERIEIVRGPTSALYGSEGLGGVIHIITKKPKAQRQTSIQAQAGTSDTYGGSGFHSQKIENLGLILAGGYEKSDGFHMVENPQSYEIRRYREMWKVFGKATYDLDARSDISFSALYYDHDVGQGRKFFHSDLQLDQFWLNYSRKGEAVLLKGLVYLNRANKTAFQDNAEDNYTSLNRKEQFPSTYVYGADFQGTLSTWTWAQLTFGAAYKEASWEYDEDYPRSARDAGANGKQRFISPFVNLDLRFLKDSLIVNLGARYDWIETSDGANWDTQASAGRPAYDNKYETNTEASFSPKLGVAYHPDDKTTLRVSGGKGFRAPSLFELYKVHVRGGGTYYRFANPDLMPEEIWSYDIGAERFLTDNFWGKLTFYQSFAKDYIGDRLIGIGKFSGGKTRYEYKLDNINEVDIYGLEAELQWYPVNYLNLFANYTYNISKIDKDENNSALEGNYLPNHPQQQVHVGVRYQNPTIIDASLIANYYADIYYDNENTLKTGDYWTVDVSLSRKFYNRFTVYLNAENIFDKKYPIFLSASSGDTIAPGAIIMGGVKVEF
ncbi:MAG: TonB-dependent receptor plug domain-containing protein [Thermodesulfobacteriota bacterium]